MCGVPHHPKRIYGRGHLHFITFSCFQRRPLLKSPASRDLFLAALDDVRFRWGFKLVGYVVMPNHVHLLIGEPGEGTPSTVLKVLKQRVSRDLRALNNGGLPTFWSARFYDFNVYSSKKLREKLDYMHANPVASGLVSDPRKWPWSSFSYYQDGSPGPISIDPIF
jgi:putative transposase